LALLDVPEEQRLGPMVVALMPVATLATGRISILHLRIHSFLSLARDLRASI
jgi:hypothetical protein